MDGDGPLTSGEGQAGGRFLRGLVGGIVGAIAFMLVTNLPVPAIDESILPFVLFLAAAPIGIAVASWTSGIPGFVGLYLGGLVGTVLAIQVETGGTASTDGWSVLINTLLAGLVPVLPLPGYLVWRLVDPGLTDRPTTTPTRNLLIRSTAVVSPLVLLVIAIGLNEASLDQGRRGSCPTVKPAPEIGGRLAFLGVNAVCVTDLTTGEITFMFEGDVAVDRSFGTPSWAPDGSALAVEVTTDRRPTTVIVPLDGSPPTTMSPPDGAWSVREPDWSPDGGRLATVVDAEGCTDCATLAFYELSTSRWEIPSTILAEGIGEPDWSPDGERLIVRGSMASDGRSAPVVVIRKDGSPVGTVTDDVSTYTGAAAWSPDGRHVVFPRLTDHGTARLWVATVDGSERRQITFTGDADTPSWSPDGRWLAFDWYDDTITAIGTQIWLSSADGGAPRLLVDGGTDAAWAP